MAVQLPSVTVVPVHWQCPRATGSLALAVTMAVRHSTIIMIHGTAAKYRDCRDWRSKLQFGYTEYPLGLGCLHTRLGWHRDGRPPAATPSESATVPGLYYRLRQAGLTGRLLL